MKQKTRIIKFSEQKFGKFLGKNNFKKWQQNFYRRLELLFEEKSFFVCLDFPLEPLSLLFTHLEQVALHRTLSNFKKFQY